MNILCLSLHMKKVIQFTWLLPIASFIVSLAEGRKVKENLQVISKVLDVLQRVFFFIERSEQVINLLLKQLCAILGREFYSGTTTSFPVSVLQQSCICRNNNQELKFVDHVNNISSTSLCILGFIVRNRTEYNLHTMKKLYNTHVGPEKVFPLSILPGVQAISLLLRILHTAFEGQILILLILNPDPCIIY